MPSQKLVVHRYAPRPDRPSESILRPDVAPLDLVSEDAGQCDVELRLTNGTTHFCTRPPGHELEHYSFSGAAPSYEILWSNESPIEDDVELELLVHEKSGAHPQLVVAREIADDHVATDLEVSGHVGDLARRDALHLLQQPILFRLRLTRVDGQLVRREISLDQLEGVLHAAGVADAELHGTSLHRRDVQLDLVVAHLDDHVHVVGHLRRLAAARRQRQQGNDKQREHAHWVHDRSVPLSRRRCVSSSCASHVKNANETPSRKTASPTTHMSAPPIR